jgi:hypothetical protein
MSKKELENILTKLLHHVITVDDALRDIEPLLDKIEKLKDEILDLNVEIEF